MAGKATKNETWHFAPEPKEYAVTRYLFEARRHYGILDARLAGRRYVLGEDYTIVDMAVWGWARMVPFILGCPASAPMGQNWVVEERRISGSS